MEKEFCPSCQKIFAQKHKCLKEERYEKIADGNRARAYKYRCLECMGDLMTPKERIEHEHTHKNVNKSEMFKESHYQIWIIVILSQLSKSEGRDELELTSKTKLGVRFKDIANVELSIIRGQASDEELTEMTEIIENQAAFYDRLFELDEFSRKTFKDQEIESIIFFQWILRFLKPHKSKNNANKKNYLAPKLIHPLKIQKQKSIKKSIKLKRRSLYSERQTAFIKKELIFNNIIDYFNVDFDLEGHTSFDSSVLKLHIFQKMLVFLDNSINVKKKDGGYSIVLLYFRLRKEKIINYLNSFDEKEVYEKILKNNTIFSTNIKDLLEKDSVFPLLKKNIAQNLDFFSELVKNYRNNIVLFKTKFSDFEERHEKERQNISKYGYKIREKYTEMVLYNICDKSEYNLLMTTVEFQKNVSESLFRSLVKSKVIAERYEEMKAAIGIFIDSMNKIRKKQLEVDTRIGIKEYCILKRDYKKEAQIPKNEKIFALFSSENSECFEDLIQERFLEGYDSIYFKKTFEICLEFANSLIFFDELKKKAFSCENYLEMEKYRVRSVYENQKKNIYKLLTNYYSQNDLNKKKFILKLLWEMYTWQNPRITHSFYVLCIESEMLEMLSIEKKKEVDFSIFCQYKIQETQEITEKHESILSKEKQYAFINKMVWKFINSAYSAHGVKYLNNRFEFYLVDPINGMPTASFFLKKHREDLEQLFDEKTKSIKAIANIWLEYDFEKIEKDLLKDYLEAFRLDLRLEKFKELLEIGNSEDMRDKILILFEELLDTCLQNFNKDNNRSIYSEYSKEYTYNFSLTSSELNRVNKLKINPTLASDLSIFRCEEIDIFEYNNAEPFNEQIFQKYRNLKRIEPKKKIEMGIETIRGKTNSVSGTVYDEKEEDPNEAYDLSQYTIFSGKEEYLSEKDRETIEESNQFLMSNEKEKWIEVKEIEQFESSKLPENLEKTSQTKNQFEISLEGFEKYEFLEINKFSEHLFESEDEKLLFLQYYKNLLNKLDLPFKMEEGKVLRKYPDLWTLKQICRIKNRKETSVELPTVEKASYSKEEKGLLKFRKCGVCMTRGRLNYCCKNCLSLYHEKCFNNINFCVVCSGELPINGVIEIYISPVLFKFYKIPFHLAQDKQPENQKNNIQIIKERGNHTFENIFSQGFIFRNHFPKILYLSDDIETKIGLYNRKYCLPLKIVKTETMGFGCFATENIEKDSYLCEYCGDVVNPSKTKNMEYTYHLWPGYTGIDEYCVCPSVYWSEANYINHSNKPNCYAQTLMSYRGPRILLFSKRKIEKDEQLFYNYNGSFALYATNWEE